MQKDSLWIDTADAPTHFPQLQENIEVDVAIIGGGITGLISAYELIRNGKSVALLEGLRIASTTTGHSTGNLYVPVQPYFQNIISKFDVTTAKKIAETRALGIDFLENVVQETGIKCNFARRPWYLHTNKKKEVGFLEKELEAFKKIELDIEIPNHLPLDLEFKKAFRLNNQARFNPYQFCIKLADYLKEQGCLIFEKTRVHSYEEKKHCTIKTSHGEVRAKNIIIATHSPVGFNHVQMFIAPYRSYVVSAKLKNQECPDAMLWDVGQPHHSISTHPWKGTSVELVMVAGQHHKTGQDKNAELNYDKLREFFKEKFEIESFPYQWSAQHFQSADDVPYIGLASHTAKNTYMATGYFADGLVYGTIAGTLLAGMILQKENPIHQVFNAQRIKPLASAGFVTKENLNVMTQFFKDYLSKPTVKLDSIRKGEGKIIDVNKKKCAAFRDENGELHVVSAVCTHLKCIVHWNNAEKSWDCPCHGSRFDTRGKVLEGPAMLDLEKIENLNK